MTPVIPWYITLAVLTGGVAVVLGVSALFAQGAARAGLTSDQRRSVLLGVGAFLALWMGLAMIVAPSLASLAGSDPYALTPTIPIFAVAGPLLAILAYRRFALLRRATEGLSLPGVIGLQIYRALGVTFLILLAQGSLPARFALPAGWGDIAVGLAAPLVGLLLARGVRWTAVVWNVAGLTDLFIAVGMGTGFATPLLMRGVTSRLPAAAAMGAFPMILVPMFAVPVAMLLHLLALRGILSAKEAGAVEARVMVG